ncbi:MAG: M23 family metallopeptidase [Pelagibacterales bacterium]|jgi:murein DD-endopeptidase MepM/ murein hydrolase activator NlpD|nr:M23 family metallopeptidase [Pelagibacterales bacterium]
MTLKNLIFISIIIFTSSCTTSKYLAPVINKNESSESKKYSSKMIKIYSGDSLYSISKREGVTIRSIIEANDLKPPFILYKGDELVIPLSKIHIVKKGNTLWEIAKCYGVSVNNIRSLNNLKIKDKIYKGRELFIPRGNPNLKADCNSISNNTITNIHVKKQLNDNKNNNKIISSSSYLWPVKGSILSKYGLLAKGLRNDGINISANKGDPVFAAESGKIVYAGNEIQAFGNLILIKHFDNNTTAYAHLEKINVKKGQSVKKGEIIASLGNSGKVSLPQLHFEVRNSNGPLNPLKYLP